MCCCFCLCFCVFRRVSNTTQKSLDIESHKLGQGASVHKRFRSLLCIPARCLCFGSRVAQLSKQVLRTYMVLGEEHDSIGRLEHSEATTNDVVAMDLLWGIDRAVGLLVGSWMRVGVVVVPCVRACMCCCWVCVVLSRGICGWSALMFTLREIGWEGSHEQNHCLHKLYNMLFMVRALSRYSSITSVGNNHEDDMKCCGFLCVLSRRWC